MDETIKFDCETEREQVSELGETLVDYFPPQVTVKNCKNCTINIYPSQTKYMETKD